MHIVYYTNFTTFIFDSLLKGQCLRVLLVCGKALRKPCHQSWWGSNDGVDIRWHASFQDIWQCTWFCEGFYGNLTELLVMQKNSVTWQNWIKLYVFVCKMLKSSYRQGVLFIVALCTEASSLKACVHQDIPWWMQCSRQLLFQKFNGR